MKDLFYVYFIGVNVTITYIQKNECTDLEEKLLVIILNIMALSSVVWNQAIKYVSSSRATNYHS